MSERDKDYWSKKADKRVIADYQEYIDEYEKMEEDLFNSYSNSKGEIRRFQGESDELNFLFKLKDLLNLKHKLWISTSRQFGYLGNIERPEPGYGIQNSYTRRRVKSWPVKFKNNKGKGHFTNSIPSKQLQVIENLLIETAQRIEKLLNAADFPERNDLTPPLPEEIEGSSPESFFENLSPLPKSDLKESSSGVSDDDSDDEFLGLAD